jgi:hypothetical protein
MSFVVKLMMGGWATTLAMIGVCALHQSGKLFKIRKRIASWVQPSDARNVRAKGSAHPGTVQAD